ncbi:hypothetical protein J0X19_01585 [Hymenobacter sp. BT186]|uniref:Uncharacterized protein n=1 Tax=Hymenobacter telluris TaxID=2816474 RepID=A0A939ESC5_9BACT|nr:hypothetical protein [Hymenobacter telluris]MBO0356625.1 hypothetical protein [Hymenobacter telluris]MBW3372650.1 hypothetical protein [Hymenobacter norwichensis]
MAPDNSEILALLADLLRATDRQTETTTRAIGELRTEMRQTAQETNARFEAIFDRFATAVADGFIRMEKKIDGVKDEVAGVKQEVADLKKEVAGVKDEVAGVKQEVTELRHDVQQIDQRLARVEVTQPTVVDVIRRLEVLENIVLNKAS